MHTPPVPSTLKSRRWLTVGVIRSDGGSYTQQWVVTEQGEQNAVGFEGEVVALALTPSDTDGTLDIVIDGRVIGELTYPADTPCEAGTVTLPLMGPSRAIVGDVAVCTG